VTAFVTNDRTLSDVGPECVPAKSAAIIAPPTGKQEVVIAVIRSLGFAGVCVVLSGLLTQAYLAVVARNVDLAEYAHFSAFWSIALVIGFGAFLPVEQELARLGPRDATGAALRVALCLAAAEVVVVLAVSPLLLESLGGDVTWLLAVLALCLVSVGQFVLRGVLVASGRMTLHGSVLLLDTALRVLFALAVGRLVTGGGSAFGWTLVAAVACAHLPVLAHAVRRSPAAVPTGTGGGVDLAEPEVRTADFARAAAPLLLGSVCAQLLLNGLPVLVAAVATPEETRLAGLFSAGFLLARVPLFVAVPLQTALLPVLARVSARGRRALIGALLTIAGVLVALAAAGALLAALAGPSLVRLVFGPEYLLGGGDLVLMVLGVVAHLGLIVTTQALVAGALHRLVAWSWGSGIAVAGVVFALVPDLLLRAELAFLLGSAAGWAVAVVLLVDTGNESRT
jgi:O-antigen/teichoic acid export membrane protein